MAGSRIALFNNYMDIDIESIIDIARQDAALMWLLGQLYALDTDISAFLNDLNYCNDPLQAGSSVGVFDPFNRMQLTSLDPMNLTGQQLMAPWNACCALHLPVMAE